MPQPTLGEVHVNAPLTNVSIAYSQDVAGNYVADKVFPPIPVKKASDVYYTYPKGNWFRSQARKRAPATESAGTGYTLATDNYRADVLALHSDVPDQIRDNADMVIDMDVNATKLVTEQLLLQRELDWLSKYFVTGVWTGGSSADPVPGTKWDAGGGTPIKDIRAQIKAMKGKTGYRANTLVLAEIVWFALQDSPDFLDRVKGGATTDKPAEVQLKLLAGLLGLDRVLVAGAVQNTAKEGAADSISHMFADNALLCYTPNAPGLMTPSAGYTFAWTQAMAGSSSIRMKRFRMEHLNADRVEGEMAYDFKVIAQDLGCLLTDVLA